MDTINNDTEKFVDILPVSLLLVKQKHDHLQYVIIIKTSQRI